MEPIFEQFKKVQKEASLNKDRKIEIRENLVHFMETYEIITEPQKTKKRHSYIFSFGAGFLITALISGGTALAAENSLPRDVLYGVKTNVTEPLIAALPLPTEAKAGWEVRLGERRLEEATILTRTGRLSEEIELELNKAFKTHVEKAEEGITQLENEKKEREAASLASRLESSLDAHGQIMSVIASPESNNKSLTNTVAETLETITGRRIEIEDKVKEKNDSQAAKDSKSKIDTLSKTRKETKAPEIGGGGDNTTSSILEKAKDNKIGLILDEAQKKQEDKFYGEAFNLINEALRETRKSKIIEEARNKFDLEEDDFAKKDWKDQLESKNDSSDNSDQKDSHDDNFKKDSSKEAED